MSEVLYRCMNDWLSYEGNKQIDIARKSGVSKQLIYMVLDKKGKKDLTFSKALSIIRAIDDDFENTMDDYCREQDKPTGILSALEYASNFRRNELLDDLIAENRDQKGEIKDWVQIYRLNRDARKYSINDAIQKCRELYGKVSSPEAKLKLELTEFDIKFNLYQSDIRYYISSFETKINELKEGFIKDSLEAKYKLFKAFISLYENNEVDKAIKLSDEIIGSSLSSTYIVGSAYHIKGHAYMYSDYDLSLNSLDKARYFYGITDEKKGNSIQEDIYFVMNVNKKEIPLDQLEGEELIHQLIIRGNHEEARSLIDNESKSPYEIMFKGILDRNPDLVFESYGLLRSAGKLFFANYIKKVYENLYSVKEVK